MPARRRASSRTTRRGLARPAAARAYRRLIRIAGRARRKAYAPYSRFRVGAAVLAADGAVYAGCNVENASYGLSLCAERVAIHRAVANGRRRLITLAVVGSPGISPCGACLQVMDEFGVRTVVIASPGGRPTVLRLRDLLPRPFVVRRAARTRRAGR